MNWMNKLMLSCRKATELMEKRTCFTLSPKEKLMLSMHTLLCDACKQYEKQSAFIHRALEKYAFPGLQEETVSGHPDPAELKKKIISRLDSV